MSKTNTLHVQTGIKILEMVGNISLAQAISSRFDKSKDDTILIDVQEELNLAKAKVSKAEENLDEAGYKLAEIRELVEVKRPARYDEAKATKEFNIRVSEFKLSQDTFSKKLNELEVLGDCIIVEYIEEN